MKHNKLVSRKKVETPVKKETVFDEEGPIYGIKENSRWVKRLKKYNSNLLERLRNWD
jgi:hypothetical protein